MRTRNLIALIGLLSGASLSVGRGDDPSPEPPPDLVCRLDSGTGKLEPSGGPRGTLVRITAPGATGTATLSFKRAVPNRLTVHFAGLRGMQTFTLIDGKQSYQGQLGWAGGKAVAYWDRNGRVVNNAALAAVTMTLEAASAGGIDVSVSTRGVELGKELKINWLQYSLKGKR